MIPYILYAALITSVCFLFYRLLLQKETFFYLHRWFFLAGLGLSFGLPLMHVPASWTWRWEGPVTAPLAATAPVDAHRRLAAVETKQLSDATVGGANEQLSDGIIVKHARRSAKAMNAGAGTVTLSGRATPVDALAPAAPGMATAASKAGVAVPATPSWLQAAWTTVMAYAPVAFHWLWLIYLCGVIIFGLNLVLQLVTLYFLVTDHRVMRDGAFRIVEMKGDRAPCSFGRYIFINPKLYDNETYHQILAHEQVHARQGHSADIVLGELSLVFQWFNPFAWRYRRALEYNLEYLTDATIIRRRDINQQSYQMSLFRVSVPNLPLGVTSNYNQSFLKKRIVMMQARQSSTRTSWKYLFLPPLLLGLLCVFNGTVAGKPQQTTPVDPVPVVAPVVAPVVTVVPVVTSTVNPVVTLNPSPLADPVVTVTVAGVHVHPVVMPDIEVNPVVDVDVDVRRGDTGSQEYTGIWMAEINGDDVELTLKSETDGGHNHWEDNSNFKKSEFSALPQGQAGDFTLTREAGMINFHGRFDGNEGFGHYTFQVNPSFRQYMESKGITGIDGDRMFGFFMVDLTKAYVESIAGIWSDKLSAHDLVSLKAMKIDAAYVQNLKDAGFKDLSIHEVVSAKAMGIDGAYAKSWANAGYNDLSMHELVAAKSMDIDASYVKGWTDAGYKNPPMHDLVAAKSMGVDPQYVKGWADAGYKDLPMHELVSAKSMDINAEYVKGWTDAGYKSPEIHDLVAAKSMGIDQDYVKGWAQDGYKDLPIHELVQAKAMGITPDYAAAFEKLGFKDIDLHTLVELKARGVTPEFISAMKDKGFKSSDIREYIKLKDFHEDGEQ